MTFSSRHSLSLLVLYAAACLTGLVFAQIGVPLPWMIGPLTASATIYVTGILTVRVPLETRPFGQMTIAAQVGLSFTPAALAALIDLAPLMVGMALIAAGCAIMVAFAIARVTGMGLVQSFLATFPTSPVEAAVTAERHGCDPAPVIVAQTARVAAVVVLVPITVYALDGWPDRGAALRVGNFDLWGNILLALLALAGALVFRKLRLSNPFFLGPLAFSSIAAAIGLPSSAFPAEILSLAQILLGTWLGSTFQRDLFISQRAVLTATLTGTLLLLALISAMAVALAWVAGMNWEIVVLGAAPGGITEMALTAKYLGLDVALVTAFQLTRIFLFMPNLPWIIRMVARHENRNRPSA